MSENMMRRLHQALQAASAEGGDDLKALEQSFRTTSSSLSPQVAAEDLLERLSDLLFYSPSRATSTAIARSFRPLLLDLAARTLAPTSVPGHARFGATAPNSVF